jgi:hypothetical protein
MKTINEYQKEQKTIATMSDMSFTEETLLNRIPASAVMNLLYNVNKETFTDGFHITAITQMEDAICHEATQFRVLVTMGYSGESDEAKWNPTRRFIFTYETKNNKAFNMSFEKYEHSYISFLTEYSEFKTFLN